MKYLHTMIRVPDLERSLEFYCGVLGMQEVKRKDDPENKFTLVFLAAPKDLQEAKQHLRPVLELTYNWEPQHYPVGRHFGHLAFEVDQIYTYCKNLMQHGVRILRPPKDGRMAFIKAPEGTSIELLQRGDALPHEEPWLSMKNEGEW